jgi:hypothetical protein
MVGRRRGPGLVGTMARTAVVAGTASAVSGNVHRRQAERHGAKQDAAAEAEYQAAVADQSQAQIAAMQAQLAALQQPVPTAGDQARRTQGRRHLVRRGVRGREGQVAQLDRHVAIEAVDAVLLGAPGRPL